VTRRGFTIYEVIIAIGISTILTIVLFNALLSGRRLSDKNLEALHHLRDASLLMEHIKTDIRNAPKGDWPIEGSNPSLMRSVSDGPPVSVKYQFDEEAGVVTRTTLGKGGRTATFGESAGQGKGSIAQFEVKKVEVPGREPFYQITLGFASAKRQADEASGKADPEKRPKSHLVQALVSRRTPTGSDDKWNVAFDT
jgi:type II secretory pathway pseudopilin PulG